MDSDSFIVGIYICIAKHVEARFETSNYELDRSLRQGKSRKSNLINEI